MSFFHHLPPSRGLPPHPPTRQPLLRSLQPAQPAQPRLSDFPDLALAAVTTTAELDTTSITFAIISAGLETLTRLRLSASAAFLLAVLAKSGPQSCADLVKRLRISSPAMTGLTARLAAMNLIGIQRAAEPDRRVVTISLTEPGRRVLASLVSLSDLGAAAALALGALTTEA